MSQLNYDSQTGMRYAVITEDGNLSVTTVWFLEDFLGLNLEMLVLNIK
jgi:hypothetical protein